MPVVAKKNTIVGPFYEYQVPSGLAVFDTVASTIPQRLHIFRAHHEKCTARRKNTLSYELRQENQRTEWLKRKYVDSVRQQQAISVTVPARMESANNCTKGVDSKVEHENDQIHGELTDQKSKHVTEMQNDSIIACQIPDEAVTKAGSSVNLDSSNIMIKTEPEAEDCLSSTCKGGPDHTTFPMKSDAQSHTNGLKRKLSLPLKSEWNSLNSTEDLKLTAYDVIAGVISTPPIKPLETDTDATYTPGSQSNPKHLGNKVPVPTTSTSTLSTAPSSTFSKKDQHSLVKELDEFSKVMHQVTQEQIAKERKESLTVYPAHTHDSPQLLSPPPYLSIGRPCPLELPAQNNFYQQQKYAQLEASPSQSQVDHGFQPGNIIETKSPHILPNSCVLGNPSSTSNRVLPTPTTPLEHFSTFSSPAPPTHLPSHPPTQSPVQPCPPPYSSTSMCYTYSSHDPIHQTVASSVNESWPLPPAQRVMHSHTGSQGTLKETILAHVSSRIVAIAGQKRPIQEVPGSSLPPTKINNSMLGLSTTNSRSMHLYQGPTHNMGPPYEGATAAPSSITFPHQPL